MNAISYFAIIGPPFRANSADAPRGPRNSSLEFSRTSLRASQRNRPLILVIEAIFSIFGHNQALLTSLRATYRRGGEGLASPSAWRGRHRRNRVLVAVGYIRRKGAFMSRVCVGMD